MTQEQYQGLNNIFKKYPVKDIPILSFTKDRQVIDDICKTVSERVMKDLSKHKSKQ